MADSSIEGTKITSVLRLTWVSDRLSHVLECRLALKMPMQAASTMPMKNRAFRAASWGEVRGDVGEVPG